MSAQAFTSVSTWAQTEPAPASERRTALIEAVAREIDAIAPHRLRVAIDGFTAAGKTSFGHELASALRALGRPTLRASLDDFKRPWSESHLYDRRTGEGYYRNAQDFDAATRLLLAPAGASGSGHVVLCSIDPITQQNQQAVEVLAPDHAVLIVDGVFAFRPEYNDHWDYRIWLDVDLDHSITRGTDRDATREGREEAERIYIAEVDPVQRADVVIDNRHFASPRRMEPPQ